MKMWISKLGAHGHGRPNWAVYEPRSSFAINTPIVIARIKRGFDRISCICRGANYLRKIRQIADCDINPGRAIGGSEIVEKAFTAQIGGWAIRIILISKIYFRRRPEA